MRGTVIHEHHTTIPRTARYYTLGEPGSGITEVWFALHGYGQLAGPFLRELAALDDGSRLIVAPEALSRFYLGGVSERPAGERAVGASWMTREDRLAEIDDQVRYLDTVYTEVLEGTDRARVCVLGFSQGAAAAARWLRFGTARAGRLILWGGEVPPDLDLSAARERFADSTSRWWWARAINSSRRKSLDRETQRLRRMRCVPPYVRGGHDIDETVLRQSAGLCAGLRRRPPFRRHLSRALAHSARTTTSTCDPGAWRPREHDELSRPDAIMFPTRRGAERQDQEREPGLTQNRVGHPECRGDDHPLTALVRICRTTRARRAPVRSRSTRRPHREGRTHRRRAGAMVPSVIAAPELRRGARCHSEQEQHQHDPRQRKRESVCPNPTSIRRRVSCCRAHVIPATRARTASALTARVRAP